MAEDSETRPFIWDIVSVLNESETKDEDISSAKESMGDQIKPYPWELLSFNPLELSFSFEPNKQTSCTLQLTNERDDQIGFDIQATNPFYEYKIEPNKGMVPPHSECNVIITLEAQQKAPQGMMRMDQLTVRMAVVEESLMAKDITPDMFDGETGNMVDEVDLAVVFATQDAKSTQTERGQVEEKVQEQGWIFDVGVMQSSSLPVPGPSSTSATSLCTNGRREEYTFGSSEEDTNG